MANGIKLDKWLKHVALSSNAISDVKIAWLKFGIDFYRSGPAFYAAVDITRKGHWSSVVQCSASILISESRDCSINLFRSLFIHLCD